MAVALGITRAAQHQPDRCFAARAVKPGIHQQRRGAVEHVQQRALHGMAVSGVEPAEEFFQIAAVVLGDALKQAQGLGRPAETAVEGPVAETGIALGLLQLFGIAAQAAFQGLLGTLVMSGNKQDQQAADHDKGQALVCLQAIEGARFEIQGQQQLVAEQDPGGAEQDIDAGQAHWPGNRGLHPEPPVIGGITDAPSYCQ